MWERLISLFYSNYYFISVLTFILASSAIVWHKMTIYYLVHATYVQICMMTLLIIENMIDVALLSLNVLDTLVTGSDRASVKSLTISSISNSSSWSPRTSFGGRLGPLHVSRLHRQTVAWKMACQSRMG